MKKYLKEIKQLPTALLNDNFTGFQVSVLLILIAAFMVAAGLAIQYKFPDQQFFKH